MLILDQIRLHYEAAIKQHCRESKSQNVPMGNFNSTDCLILNPSSLKQGQGKDCDCIFICLKNNAVFIALVECKTRNLGSAITQLQACHALLLEILNNINCPNYRLKAAIYSSGGRKPSERKAIDIKKNYIGGAKIVTKKFNQPISSLFN